jgi:hypothetical protein
MRSYGHGAKRDSKSIVVVDASALDALADKVGGLIICRESGLMRNLLLGGGARLANYIRDDSGHAMVRDAVQTLHDGNQLVCFPEGTRTATWPVNAFKPGLTLIASRAHVSFKPSSSRWARPTSGKGGPFSRPRECRCGSACDWASGSSRRLTIARCWVGSGRISPMSCCREAVQGFLTTVNTSGAQASWQLLARVRSTPLPNPLSLRELREHAPECLYSVGPRHLLQDSIARSVAMCIVDGLEAV